LGGTREGESIEIKGFLLGKVEQAGDEFVVMVLHHCPISLSHEDTVASAVFTAKDLAVLERQRKNHPELQVLGSYHSHPGHGTRLSEDDVDHLQQWFPEPFQIGAIVEPTRREIGFFVKDGAKGFAGRLDPTYLVSFDRSGKHDALVRGVEIPGPPPPPPPPWLPWVKGAAAGVLVAVVAVAIIVLLWEEDQLPPVQFVEEPVKKLNLTDENARFEVAIAATEDAVVRVEFYESESSDKFSLQLQPDPDATGSVELSAGDTLYVTATAKHGELEFDGEYDTVLSFEYKKEDAKEDPWFLMGESSLHARGSRGPVEEHDWLNWGGDVDVGTDGTVTVTVERPEGSVVSLSGAIGVRNSNHSESFNFRIEAGIGEARVKLDRDTLGEAERWPRMDIGAECESENETGPLVRWVSRTDDEISYTRVDTRIGVQVSYYEVNRCRITITSPQEAVDTVRYKVTKDSEHVRAASVEGGETDSFDYECESHSLELSVKSYFYGNGGVFRAMGRVIVESPDWGFTKNQGEEGLRVLEMHRDIYEARGLARLGEMKAIPHADDVADSQDWKVYYFIVFTKNNAVQESWEDFADAADDAEQSGCGKLAWSCQGGDYVSLGFVMSVDTEHEDAVMRFKEWFASKPDLRAHLSENAEATVLRVRQESKLGVESDKPFRKRRFTF